jgi:hypothetical protein
MWPSALFIVVMVAVLGLNLWAQWRVYRDSPKRRPRDISHEHRPVAIGLADWSNQLSLLGFDRLGEIELDLPSVGILEVFRSRTTSHTGWVRVDRHRSTTASIVPQLVEFSTQLADGTFVETMFPIGHSDSLPGLELRHVKSSLADAARSHENTVAMLSMRHGEPRPVEAISAYLRQDAEFREKHALVVLRRPFVRRQLIPALVSAAVVVFVIALTAGSVQ